MCETEIELLEKEKELLDMYLTGEMTITCTWSEKERKKEGEKRKKKKKRLTDRHMANLPGASNQVEPAAPEVEPESSWASRLMARTCISRAAM